MATRKPHRQQENYLTIAELVQFGSLGTDSVVVKGAQTAIARHIVLASDLESLGRCQPEAVVVLHPNAASGPWALESALRLAWERSASCVVASASAVSTPAPEALARRLGLWLIAIPGDPSPVALALATQVDRPRMARLLLVARCGQALYQARTIVEVLEVLNAELAGTRVALCTLDGELIAGAPGICPGADRLTVDICDPEGKQWAILVAVMDQSVESAWRDTVLMALRAARAPLNLANVWAAQQTSRRLRADRALLSVLLPTEQQMLPAYHEPAQATIDWAEVGARGWPVEPPLQGICLRPKLDLDARAHNAVLEAWGAELAHAPLIPWANVFLTWRSARQVAAGRLHHALRAVRAVAPISAGVGLPVDSADSLGLSLQQAMLAAAVAPHELAAFADVGVGAVLAAVRWPVAAQVAQVVLPQTDLDALQTLKAYLDVGGSVAEAADVLGVHRNTVTARLDRLRASGVDFNQHRLALHLAVAALFAQ